MKKVFVLHSNYLKQSIIKAKVWTQEFEEKF
jgi:hypothetical protein